MTFASGATLTSMTTALSRTSSPSDVCVFSLVHSVEEAGVDFRDYRRGQKVFAVGVLLQVDDFSDDCI